MAGELPPTAHAATAPLKNQRQKGRNHRHPQGQPERHRSLRPALPELLGGSADLAGSNLTLVRRQGRQPRARRQPRVLRRARIRHGRHHERRHACTAAIPFGATFLMFSEYARNALRMAALMKINPIFVFPRLHRFGRRRPDPPAGRANRHPAPDPEHGHLASG